MKLFFEIFILIRLIKYLRTKIQRFKAEASIRIDTTFVNNLMKLIYVQLKKCANNSSTLKNNNIYKLWNNNKSLNHAFVQIEKFLAHPFARLLITCRSNQTRDWPDSRLERKIIVAHSSQRGAFYWTYYKGFPKVSSVAPLALSIAHYTLSYPM